MHRNHIRSYRITDNGDIEVIDGRGGETANLSGHYLEVARDRGRLRLEASLDIFRFADGQFAWAASLNGHDAAAAASLHLLLGLFLEDLLGSVVAPRSF